MYIHRWFEAGRGGRVVAMCTVVTQDFQSLCAAHFASYPDLQPQDLYKLAHQACMGPGHLIDGSTQTIVHAAMLAELRGLSMAPSAQEDVVEVLHEGTSMARVYLRAYTRAGGDLQRLASAMIGTSEKIGEGDREMLGGALGAFRTWLTAHPPQWELSSFDAILRDQVEAGMKPVSHSDIYRQAYDPHYRVVMLDLME